MSKPQELRTALVTGASSGIGLEMAKILASKGIDLVLASRGIDKLREIGKDLEKQYSIKTTSISADLSKPGAAEELFAACEKQNLKIDYLINNAGIGLFGENCSQSTDEVKGMLVLNMESLTVLCMQFGKKMSETGGGSILNIGSLVGKMPVPFFAAYSASKSYVINYSMALRAELKKKGVSVTCVMPGFVQTNFDHSAGIRSDKYLTVSKMSGMGPEKVAKIAITALLKKKSLLAAGLSNRFASFFLSFMPKKPLAAIIRFSMGLLK